MVNSFLLAKLELRDRSVLQAGIDREGCASQAQRILGRTRWLHVRRPLHRGRSARRLLRQQWVVTGPSAAGRRVTGIRMKPSLPCYRSVATPGPVAAVRIARADPRSCRPQAPRSSGGRTRQGQRGLFRDIPREQSERQPESCSRLVPIRNRGVMQGDSTWSKMPMMGSERGTVSCRSGNLRAAATTSIRERGAMSSGDRIGLLGILLAVGLLIGLAFRGFSLLLAAPAVALLAVAFSGGPLLANLTQTFLCPVWGDSSFSSSRSFCSVRDSES